MGGFGDVVGYAAEGLADDGRVRGMGGWVGLVGGTGEGRVVTGEIDGEGAGYEDVDRWFGLKDLGCAWRGIRCAYARL